MLEVDLRHVSLYNDELAHAIQDRPADILPLVNSIAFSQNFRAVDAFSKFENAATKTARLTLFPLAANSEDRTEAAAEAIPKVQVTVKSGLNLLQVRELTATMSKAQQTGSNSRYCHFSFCPLSRAVNQCRACWSSKIIYPQGGLGVALIMGYPVFVMCQYQTVNRRIVHLIPTLSSIQILLLRINRR